MTIHRRRVSPRVLVLASVGVMVVVSTLLLVGISRERPRTPIVFRTTAQTHPRSPLPVPVPPVGRSLFLVVMGDFPVADAEALVVHYREKFDISIELLPSIPMPPEAYDAERDQYIAEALIRSIGERHDIAVDPDAVVIALTNADIYIAGQDWTYAYGLRADGHLAIVSSARMNAFFADDNLEKQRLRKMVTKNIGVLYYGLPVSDDPGSVLYRDILGPQDLDRASEDF